jgi:hypothetical protein
VLPDTASVRTDELAHYPHVPEYYLVARGLSEDDVQAVINALHITPITLGIVIDPSDGGYCSQFANRVSLVGSLVEAKQQAQLIYDTADSNQFARSVIITGQTNKLVGVYQTREANIPC